jgi:hypothetical protein
MTESRFNVIGGEYADTSFTTLLPGTKAERYGPMSRDEALTLWRSLSSQALDNCMVRYYVRAVEEAVAEKWYVVGGEYSDTSFTKLAPGQTLECHGPYADRTEALQIWRSLTGKTVDNAVARFGIVDQARLDEMKRNS